MEHPAAVGVWLGFFGVSDMPSNLQRSFDLMKQAHKSEPNPSFDVRVDRLRRLEDALLAYEDQFVSAISDDFSNRPAHETRAFDVLTTLAEIRVARKNLRKWMKTKRIKTPLYLLPARARLMPQPLGVVGIISPWNFPLNLSLVPAVGAIAAGCRVMIKPSELSPKTSRLLAEMIESVFSAEEICVIEGEADVAAAFSALPFDHLFFTGSTAVGRKVAEAAAKNLTPVTLELGGKSPAVIMPSADMNSAARRIAWGKLSNAGQICVAPDYVMVPRKSVNEFVALVQQWSATFYPEGTNDDGYTHIISERHRARLAALVEEANNTEAKVVSAMTNADSDTRAFPLTLIIDPPPNSTVMQEEIFGPILPIIPFDEPSEAIEFVSERDHPLALYVFAQDREEQNLWLESSISGGVTVNDTVIHTGFDTLPFGGVGSSGYGGYHGQHSFNTFSHLKSVVFQPRWNTISVFESPMTNFKLKVFDLVRRIL